MRVLTTVQKALWALTVPVRGEGVEGVPGLPMFGGSEENNNNKLVATTPGNPLQGFTQWEALYSHTVLSF